MKFEFKSEISGALTLFAIALFALALVLVLLGCGPVPERLHATNGMVYEVTEVEGCEYLVVFGNRERLITHKGNCKNLIHSHNQ